MPQETSHFKFFNVGCFRGLPFQLVSWLPCELHGYDFHAFEFHANFFPRGKRRLRRGGLDPSRAALARSPETRPVGPFPWPAAWRSQVPCFCLVDPVLTVVAPKGKGIQNGTLAKGTKD